MIRTLAIAVALTLGAVGSAGAGGVEILDAEDGFRDARFGARIESFEGLELISDQGANGTKLYVRPADLLDFGDAQLDGISYGFYHGELYFVALFTSGSPNAQSTLAQLEKTYGPGRKVDGSANEYIWYGRKVILHFREDPATAMGMVGFTSLPIDARARAERPSLPAEIAP